MSAETYALGIRVGEALLGTCTSFVMVCEGLEIDEGLENDNSFCAGLDRTAMECRTCGWWCEPCELDDHGDCGDCHDDEEENDMN